MRPPRLALRPAALAAVLAAALATGACTVDLPGNQPPPRLFVLTPKNTFPADLPQVTWQLSVDVPIAEAGLNTARIAVRRSPYTLEYFERAGWTDTAPRMIQTLLVESFENTGRIVAVARQSVSIRADYILVPELREFQAEYASPTAVPEIRVRLNAKVIRQPQRAIVASENFEAVVPAASNSMGDIIAAFDDAMGKVLKRTVEWTLAEAERAK